MTVSSGLPLAAQMLTPATTHSATGGIDRGEYRVAICFFTTTFLYLFCFESFVAVLTFIFLPYCSHAVVLLHYAAVGKGYLVDAK